MTHSFVEYAFQIGAIKGAQSQYTFDAGAFNDFESLRELMDALGRGLRLALSEKAFKVDVLFGSTPESVHLAGLLTSYMGSVWYPAKTGLALSFEANGRIVGASLAGKRVLVVDNIRNADHERRAEAIISAHGGTVVGYLNGYDDGDSSSQSQGIVRFHAISLSDILIHIHKDEKHESVMTVPFLGFPAQSEHRAGA